MNNIICYEVMIYYHVGCNYGNPFDYAPIKSERKYVRDGLEVNQLQEKTSYFIAAKLITGWKIKQLHHG